MNIHFNKSVLLLYIAFFTELLIFFFFRQRLGPTWSPVLFTLSSLAVAIVPLFIKKDESISTGASISPIKKYIYVVYALIGILFAVWTHHILSVNPIDIKKSDIIPVIDQVYLDRFIHGEYVYKVAPGWGYGDWVPNYLPMHWMPFLISKYLGVDHRWIPLLFYLVASFIYMHRVLKSSRSFSSIWMHATWPLLLLLLIFIKQSNEIAHTIELLIASYYMMLSVFLLNNNILGRAIGMGFTLLSRYALVFYIPIALVIEWLANRKKLWWELGAVAAFVSIFYIIPFFLHDTSIFSEGNKSYDIAAVGEWKGQSWQAPGDKPFQLYQGLGFASWAYEKLDGDLLDKVHQYRNILLYISLLVCILMLALVYYFRKKIPAPVLHLVSLKVILTIVFALVFVPYSYLYWSSLVVSLVILSNYDLVKKGQTG